MSQTTSNFGEIDRQRLCLLQKLGIELRHFFDVGASDGCWSRAISEDFPDATFELFEPLIDHAPAYRKNMEETLAKHPRFRLHKAAMGTECKRTKMYLYPDNVVGSTALELGAAPQGSTPVEVDMLTIDHAVQALKLPVPQAIKMDTQGCELSVLQGAQQTLPQVQVLLLECWLWRGYGQATPLLLEVANWLRNFDFHLWDFGDVYRDESGVLAAQDCIFLNARSKVSRLKEEPRRHTKPVPGGNLLKRAWNSLGRRT
jgi:FkbM family methyltransferase